MFLQWFLWQLEYVDTTPPISEWRINIGTKQMFIALFAELIKEK